jgi:hypothetical protein
MRLNKVAFKITVVFGMLIFSGCLDVLEKPLDNQKLELSNPKNNMNFTDSAVAFYWYPLDGAQSYQLQVVFPSFDSLQYFVMDTTIQNTVFYLSATPGRYQWRVRAFNSSSTSPFSDTLNFSVE